MSSILIQKLHESIHYGSIITNNRVRVIIEYVREFDNPIHITEGNEIEIIQRNEGRYKEWYWCKSKEGTLAFVPESYLQVSGNAGLLKEDYDSTELTVFKGQILYLQEETGGWTWCRTEDGEYGWVPNENIEPVD